MGQLLFPSAENVYVLDANVFMTAHHDYYAPDLCPGFWECLEHYSRAGRLSSIDRVRSEILSPDKLVEWIKQAPSELFRSSAQGEVVEVFSDMQTWVQGNAQFLSQAKEEFARVADGWLAAYAKVHGAVVVTQEVFDPNVRKRVPLPNVCKKFHVTHRNMFEMLRELGVRFDWSHSR